MSITVEKKKYPSGAEYYDLSVNGVSIGSVVDAENNKYLARGRRKPVDTLNEAAKQLLDSSMNDCMKEHDRWRKLLGIVLRGE